MPEPVSALVFAGFCTLNMAALSRSAVSPEANSLRKGAVNALQHHSNSVALYGHRAAAISVLVELYNECSTPGWDGTDADPICPATLDQAVRFIQAIPEDLPMPEISAEMDGAISMDWMHSRRRRLSISVGSTDRLAYAWLDGTRKGHGVERFDQLTVPARILEEISRLTNHGTSAIRTAL